MHQTRYLRIYSKVIHSRVANLGAAAACCLIVGQAHAQAPLPGVIISPSPSPSAPMPVPSSPMMPGMMPPPQAAPAPPPAATPQVKPKPVARAKKPVEAAASDTDTGGVPKGPSSTRIGLLVNGEPITAYEIEQRARLMALGADIQSRAQARMKELASSESVNARWKQIVQDTVNANQGKTREQIMAILQEKQKVYSMGLQKQAVESARAASIPAMRENAKKELIEEIIKIQDARRSGATPDESMVEDLIKDLAQRNKMTALEFARHFGGMGIDIMTLKARYRAQLAWTDAVRKQYSHLTQPSQRQLDAALVNFTGGEDQVELQLHRIIIPVPPKLDQRAMAGRLAEAEKLQGQFKSCNGVGALAARVDGARHENMGSRNISSFPEPSRTMLLNAQENSMVPPAMTSTGIELYAVCGRKVIKAAEVKRTQLANEERQGTFERLSKSHLRKLLDSAIIENR
jgi:peptidyl-prolyl cis-trans isomerase SurA